MLSNGYSLTVQDLDKQPFPEPEALHAERTREMGETRDAIICMFGTRPGKGPTSSTVTLWSCFTALHDFSIR